MRLILTLLLIFIAMTVKGQIPVDPGSVEEENIQQETQDDQQNSQTEPDPEQEVVFPLQSDTANNLTNADADGGRDGQNSQARGAMFQWPPRFTSADTYAQWIMALFGVVATGVSIYAVALLKGTLRYTKKAAKSTGRTLKIAEDTLAVTKANALAEIRAYLSLSDFKMVFYGTPGEFRSAPIRVIYTLENAGNTPAFNVKCGLDGCYSEGFAGMMPDRLVMKFNPDMKKIGTLSKGLTVGMESVFNILAEEIENLMECEGTIFIRFFIQYNDVFYREIQSYTTGFVRPYELFTEDYVAGTEVEFRLELKGGFPFNGEAIIDQETPPKEQSQS